MDLFKRKKTNYFFEQFAVVGSYSLKAIETLEEGIKKLDETDLLTLKNNVHTIEHQADLIKAETEERLAKEFMTPIDREDIFMLLDNIDDLTDAIDEVSYKMYLRNYQTLPKNVDFFLAKAKDGVITVNELLKNLPSLTNKKLMDPLIVKIRTIEEETDHLLEENIHAFYVNPEEHSRAETREAEDIFGMFEYITDKCRDVTKTIEIIMYKNL